MRDHLITDLAATVGKPAKASTTGIGFHSATIKTWDADTLTASVEYQGATLPDVPVLAGLSALTFTAGEEVAMLSWHPPDGHRRRGFGSYWILGKVVRPGADRGTLDIKGGNLVLRNGDLVILDAAGNEAMRLSTSGLTLQGVLELVDAGRFSAQDENGVQRLAFGNLPSSQFPNLSLNRLIYADASGNQRVIFGDIASVSTGALEWIGLLVQGSTLADIFKAYQDISSGDRHVVIGSDVEDIESFSADAEEIVLNATSGILYLIPDSRVIGMTISNTTGSANMLVGGSSPSDIGQVQRITSAARFKLNTDDLHVDPRAVLRLRPRTWRDRGEVEANPDTDRWHVGFVAEEVDDAGLHELVDYDEHGQPLAVAYDRMSVALLALLQDQQRRLDRLEAHLELTDEPAARAATVRKPKRRADRIAGVLAPPVKPESASRPTAAAPGTPGRPEARPAPSATPKSSR